MTRTTIIILLTVVLFFACKSSEDTPDSGQILSADAPATASLIISDSFDTPPLPRGGMEAIQKKLTFPESARKANLEGKVLVELVIGKEGQIIKSEVIKHPGSEELARAALEAVHSVEWRPAQKDNEPVTTKVTLPVVFALGQAVSKSFVAYDTPPAPQGGFSAIQKNLTYPSEAKTAGMEGRVVLNLCIDEKGNIIDSKVLKTIDCADETANTPDDYGLSDAALQAVKSIEWEPAKKNGQPVKVWVGIPVVFKLK